MAEWLPYAITYGMTHEQFWDANPAIINAYVTASQRKTELVDELMWAMGNYIYMATYSAVGRIFCGKKFVSVYPEKPLSMVAKVSEEERYEEELRKALAAEEAYILQQKRAGLPDHI